MLQVAAAKLCEQRDIKLSSGQGGVVFVKDPIPVFGVSKFAPPEHIIDCLVGLPMAFDNSRILRAPERNESYGGVMLWS